MPATEHMMDVDPVQTRPEAGNDRPGAKMDIDGDRPGTVATKKKLKTVFTTDLLRQYYARLFPYKQMFKWLSYGNDPARARDYPAGAIDKDYFMRREFSFTIANDIYIRYLCFRNAEELQEAIQKKQPHKIDIGAVYTAPQKIISL